MWEKKKKEWPEYTSWWDRNEFKINVILWAVFFGLLLMAYILFKNEPINLDTAVLWLFLFIVDLFLLSFTSNGVNY